MDWQQAAALGVVALTLALFVIRAWRRNRQPAWQRATGCGCPGGSAGPRTRLCVSGRRGERPKVTVQN